MGDGFAVTVSAGTLRPVDGGLRMPHAWTPEGVVVQSDFTGAHVLHLAVAACVLNDLYREGRDLGVELAGARVVASGDFDSGSWASTGIHYRVDLDTGADPDDVRQLLARVDEVAEIPRAIRAGAPVQRVEVARS